MWFFETGVTHLLGRKYQNRCWVGITETCYTFSLLRFAEICFLNYVLYKILLMVVLTLNTLVYRLVHDSAWTLSRYLVATLEALPCMRIRFSYHQIRYSLISHFIKKQLWNQWKWDYFSIFFVRLCWRKYYLVESNN